MVYVTGLVVGIVLVVELPKDVYDFEGLLGMLEDVEVVGEADEVDDALEDEVIEELELEMDVVLEVELVMEAEEDNDEVGGTMQVQADEMRDGLFWQLAMKVGNPVVAVFTEVV